MAFGSIQGQTSNPQLQQHINDTNNPHETKASNTPYDNTTTQLPADTVQEAIDQLFTDVSDGKDLIASAITDMGVPTSSDATFETMSQNISQIETGTDTSDATNTADKILSPYTAYIAEGKVIGTIQSQGAQTITPSTENQTIQSGIFLSGQQTILGDTNLIPENIANDVRIFGVEGTLLPKKDINFNYSRTSNGYIFSLGLAVYYLGYPRFVNIIALNSVASNSNTVASIFCELDEGSSTGIGYIVCGNGEVQQFTVKVLPTEDRNYITISSTTSFLLYLPNGYNFDGTYNLFVNYVYPYPNNP